jgi:hypothetical protein
MRFKTPLMEAIRDGRKTVTRRVVQFHMVDGVLTAKPCMYKVGRVYMASDRPRFKKTTEFLRIPIRIVSVEREHLSQVTRAEAMKEGFIENVDPNSTWGLSSNAQFLIAWGSIHGWPEGDTEVWRIEFTRVPPGWKRG